VPTKAKKIRVLHDAEKMTLENTLRTTLGDMNVIAQTHLLREQKSENIVRIKIKFTEDGMEWQKVEHSDGSRY
jgi:hypothetical protein